MTTRRFCTPLLGLILLALGSCGGIPLSPVTSDRRPVRLASDPSKTLSVGHELVFDDATPPHNELRLPPGVYALEGSDDEYWYLRAGTPLEFTAYHMGGKVETRHLAGGIMLGKYSFRAVPAGAYIDGDEASARILVWKLPPAFISGEGRDWRRSF